MKLDARWTGLAIGVMMTAGCTINHDVGVSVSRETIRSTQIVARDKVAKAEMVQAEFSMGAGKLELRGGAKEFFEGEFAYSVPEWKPEVRFEGGGFRGRLNVQQGGKGTSQLGEMKNEWVMRLANDIPLDLNIRCGAGENELDLHELTIRSAEVHLGAGQVNMDLRIHPVKDVDVKIEGGVGEAKVRVPRELAVEAEASGGIGEIKVEGMRKDGNRWVTEAYGKGGPTIRLSVKGGIGSIRIVAE